MLAELHRTLRSRFYVASQERLLILRSVEALATGGYKRVALHIGQPQRLGEPLDSLRVRRQSSAAFEVGNAAPTQPGVRPTPPA